MATLTLQAAACPDKALALTNRVFVNPADAARLFEGEKGYLQCDNMIYVAEPHDSVNPGSIAFNSFQRRSIGLAMGSSCQVSTFQPPTDNFNISELTLTVDTTRPMNVEIDGESLVKLLKSTLMNHVFTVGQILVVDHFGVNVQLAVQSIEAYSSAAFTDNENAAQAEAVANTVQQGKLISDSAILLVKAQQSNIRLVNVKKAQAPTKIFRPDFSFAAMGIGGLDKEFADIFRRAFASRVFPADIVQKLGVRHVKGMLLYGPPGCGKTLIARQIGKMLNGREPKVVNGPEILNKYVGQSEENIRALFKDAEEEYKERGDDSELHIVIFDEIDAICKQRGSTRDGTGTGDSIVNQLLSKLDGVDALNNVLVIGMTNRKDMIDEALLRPGRLEVHMEIGLPDEGGRLQILNIHTAKMREFDKLSPDVDLNELAADTKNFSGAEIEGLVKSAASFAFERQIDASNMTKVTDLERLQVQKEDFERALSEVIPAFGAATEDFEGYFPNGMLNYGDRYVHILQTGRLLIDQAKQNPKTPLITMLLEGPTGSGKTALAATLALASDFPYIKVLSADQLIGYSEASKISKIHKIFDDAYRSQYSVIVLDEIERLLEYVAIGPRFSNAVLQALLVLIKKAPPKGRKLLVVATTANATIMEDMELLSAFNVCVHVPSLTKDEIITILEKTEAFNPSDVKAAADVIEGEIGIKKLLLVVEMAKDLSNNEKITVARFMECLQDAGIPITM